MWCGASVVAGMEAEGVDAVFFAGDIVANYDAAAGDIGAIKRLAFTYRLGGECVAGAQAGVLLLFDGKSITTEIP